ncbi:unnamed protein product [Lepidochelys olivacea]
MTFMVFSSILPVEGKGQGRDCRIVEVNEWLRRWCRREGFGFFDHGMVFHEGGVLGRDGLHLTKRGKSIFASRLANLVRMALNRGKETKALRGGSLGKGTSLKGGSDADLVVFLSCFKGYSDQETTRAAIIKEIKRMLEKCQQQKQFEVSIKQSRWPNPRVLSFMMSSKTLDESIEFDMLPACNALSTPRGGEFSTCFTELQRDFVVDRRTKVKSLIRLVKYWYKQGTSVHTKSTWKRGSPCPPQYALELLSVYAWEQGSRDRAFDMAKGFRTVLELIRHYKKLSVYWTINYNFADKLLERFLHRQLQKDRSPLILDLADLMGIVGEGSSWDLVAWACCCGQQCCRKPAGSALQPWPALVRAGLPVHVGGAPAEPGPAPSSMHKGTKMGQASESPLPSQQVFSLSPPDANCSRLVPSSVAPVVRLLMWLNQSMGLYQMPAEELDTFITNNLQPNQVFKMQISTAINTIFLFLTQNCFRNSGSAMRVLKVVKAGSSGKGTALKDVSDVDLVVFVSKITDFRALKAERKKIIAEIQTRLEECRGSLGKDLVLSIKKTKWENPRVLTFTLTSNTMGEHIDFDVLPAFDALGQLYRGYKPDPEVYVRLMESDPEGSEFSPCFTELQRNFVMALPTKLKSLIRLVKHWYKQYVLPHKKKLGREESLPPQYALELLSVYAWERGGRGPAFNMAEGFRTVLELIRQHAQLCVYWTINYGFENETLGWYLKYQLYKSRPIILDPADPTGIVGHGSRWDLVAQEAERCCAQQCCWKRNGSPVQPWNVPLQQTWRAAEGDDFDLQSRTTDKEYPITENQMFANGSHAAEEESYCTLL